MVSVFIRHAHWRTDANDAVGQGAQQMDSIVAVVASVTTFDDRIGHLIGSLVSVRATFNSEDHAFATHVDN